MAHPYHHALSSVKKWGGTVDDYLAVHSWFDQSKEITADFRHRALRTMRYPDSIDASYSCARFGLCRALGLRDEPAPARSPSKGP